jgi:putative ABC transport system ATP-binding protein
MLFYHHQNMAKKIISAESITKSFTIEKTKQYVLRGVNLAIKEGEFIAIMGPSGSGKSTLLGILAGLDTPDSGKVYVRDQEISKYSENKLAKFRNENIGFVFQSYQLLSTLSVLENIQAPMFVSTKKVDVKEDSLLLANKLGLQDKVHNLPRQLSGGEQQRVAIARALANKPSLLFADEPTGNLDSANGNKILQIFKNLQQEQSFTIVLVTHDTNIAALADRIIYINDGTLYEKI